MRYKRTVNLYFFIPFLLWCCVGGFLLLRFNSNALFYFINQHHNIVADKAMEIASSLGEAWVIILIGSIFLMLKPFRNIWFFSAAVLCTVLPAILTQIIKYQVAAPRPMTVYATQTWVHFLPNWDLLHNDSFPSGHTTGAFSFFCFLACAMPYRYRFYGVLFFIFALLTAYARVYLTAHFFRDVYVGSIIGTIVAFIVFQAIYYFKKKATQAPITSQ